APASQPSSSALPWPRLMILAKVRTWRARSSRGGDWAGAASGRAWAAGGGVWGGGGGQRGSSRGLGGGAGGGGWGGGAAAAGGAWRGLRPALLRPSAPRNWRT